MPSAAFTIDICPTWAIVEYKGKADRLLAIGAVEPRMLAGARTYGTGEDSHGYSYMRKTSAAGSHAITRWIKSLAVLRTLPCVTDDAIPAANLWLAEHPNEIHIQTVDGREILTGSKEALAKHKVVLESDFKYASAGIDAANYPGYLEYELWDAFDGCFRVVRRKPAPITPKRWLQVAEDAVAQVRRVAMDQFSPDAAFRVGQHLDAIMTDLGRERSGLTAHGRRSQMRLVVDNEART